MSMMRNANPARGMRNNAMRACNHRGRNASKNMYMPRLNIHVNMLPVSIMTISSAMMQSGNQCR